MAIINDNRYTGIGELPSLRIPYRNSEGEPSFDDIYVRKFGFNELQLISMAATTGDMRHMIRAVNNSISVDVYQLTIADFYYLIMWLKLNNYPKTQNVVTWKCVQPIHKHKETEYPLFMDDATVWPEMHVIEADYKLSVCDTSNTSLISFSDLTITHPDDDIVLPEGMDYPRVAVLADLQEALLDNGLTFLAPAIQWVAGSTWSEKLAKVKADDTNELLESGFALNKLVSYGVSERVQLSCSHCRAKYIETLSLDPANFFQ